MHLSTLKFEMNSILDPKFSFWNFQFGDFGGLDFGRGKAT